MSGSGMISGRRELPGAALMLNRASVVETLEARAAAVEAAVDPNKMQAHSKMLPTEAELDRARFAARQLRIAADDFRAGLETERD